MVVFALLGIRLPFRVIYGVTFLVPHPSLSVSSMGKGASSLWIRREDPRKSPPQSTLRASPPAHQSLGASDLGDIVVGKQALLAS